MQAFMKKLNKRKIRWIVREIDKQQLSVYAIAKQQKITPQHTRRVYKKFKGIKDPVLLNAGRKPRPYTEEETKLVEKAFKKYGVSAVILEKIIQMPHNTNAQNIKGKRPS